MKQIGTLVFIGLIILNMITYKSCKNNKEKYKQADREHKELITKFDSIIKLPPDTIRLPAKIVKKDTVIYRTRWKDRPVGPGLQPQMYKDSIINDSIDLRVEIAAVDLYDIKYDYRPVYKYQETIVEKKVPYPINIIREVKVNQRGLFMNAGLGYSDRFSAKLGLMYLTRKQSTYSYDLVRYGDNSIHILSYGIAF